MTNIHTFVARNILRHIKENDLEFGDKLPSERQLSATFGVSRNSVREGIRSLIEKGILSSRRGDGTYVTMPEQTLLEGSLTKVLSSGVHSKDIFQIRYILEPQMAALAALNASSEQIKNLKVMAFDMNHKALAGGDVTSHDVQFHLTIARCTGNELLVRLIDCLGEILTLTRQEEKHDLQGRAIMASKAHFKIVEGIADGNAEAAKEAMRTHIRYAERHSQQSCYNGLGQNNSDVS